MDQVKNILIALLIVTTVFNVLMFLITLVVYSKAGYL